MLATTCSVAFSGIDVLKITIEVQITKGLPSFTIVGLADKAIADMPFSMEILPEHMAQALMFRLPERK